MGVDRRRREVVIGLLVLLGCGNAAGIGCVVVSLTTWAPGGLQLLASATVVLMTNAITFALVFWELDCGGPVARAVADRREWPDFWFPQDEYVQLARPGWSPRLVDYAYLSVTNSVAFSPTDAMPLTIAATFVSTSPSGSATSRTTSSVTSVAMPAVRFGQAIQSSRCGKIASPSGGSRVARCSRDLVKQTTTSASAGSGTRRAPAGSGAISASATPGSSRIAKVDPSSIPSLRGSGVPE